MSAALIPVMAERIEESLAAIAFHIAGTKDPVRRDFLIRDFASRVGSASDSARSAFSTRMMDLLADRIPEGAWSETLHSPNDEAQGIDVLIMAVQPIERRALLDAFGNPPLTKVIDGREYFELGLAVPGSAQGLSCVLTASMAAQNARTVRAVMEISRSYSPRLWVMIGMAAGVEGVVKLGDVVLPTTCLNYESGRLVPDGFEPRAQFVDRPKAVSDELWNFEASDCVTPATVEAWMGEVRLEHRPGAWDDRIPEVSVRDHTAASGDKLLRDGELLRGLHASNQNVRVGDEESYGFGLACSSASWLIARGVADYGNPSKSDGWQYAATFLAAKVIRAFLEFRISRLDPEF